MPTPYKVLSRPSEITPPPAPEGSGSIPAPGSVSFPEWLLQKTFAIQYNPNCYRKWLVRMAGKSAVIDLKPYVTRETGDALGFGHTLEEAAKECLAAYDAKKQNGAGCAAAPSKDRTQ
jgi:hypothetical protein